MHTLIVGLMRNLAQTLPEVDGQLAARERALLTELAQVREARRLVGAMMTAADITSESATVLSIEMDVAA